MQGNHVADPIGLSFFVLPKQAKLQSGLSL